MIISDFTIPEINVFRKQCNFVENELKVFELRSKGVPLKIIACETGLTLNSVKKTSRKVNNKIQWICENYVKN